jgi:ABC-type polysaccharide/polyol phosphate transport system ATPase subunit
MSEAPAIQVNHLSKTFKLYPTRRSRMFEMIHPLRKKLHRKFEALKDVSFEVNKGEVVGLIGQNGSGKSTILKILSSVVTPTSGTFQCNGRLTSLLELGGGFNLELTGIENVYFIGALQGYRKSEMKKRMDKILEFSEIGEYANQPVKNYSSGMYVRLAFSININIDPEILIIDEALSVGDMRFQQKCFRRIKEFKKQGKTILICSHSMGSIRDFCDRAIWLHKGKLMEDGDPKLVTDHFTEFMSQEGMKKSAGKPSKNGQDITDVFPLRNLPHPLNTYIWQDMRNIISSGENDLIIHHATIINEETHKGSNIFTGGETISLGLIAEQKKDIYHADIKITMNGQFGNPVIIIYLSHFRPIVNIRKNQPVFISVKFQMPPLSNGVYTISFNTLDLSKEGVKFIHSYHDALVFEISSDEKYYYLGTQLVMKDVEVKTNALLLQE